MNTPPSAADGYSIPSWIQSSIAGAALAGSVILLWVGRDQLTALRDIDPTAIAAVLLINVGYYLFTSQRHLAVLQVTSARTIGGSDWFRLFIVGRTLNELIPQGGHVYRSVILKSELGVATHEYLASILAYAWFLNAQNLCVVIFTIAIAPESLPISSQWALPITIATLVVFLVAPLIASGLAKRFRQPGRLAKVGLQIVAGLSNFSRHKRGMARATIFGLLSFISSVATVGIVFAALDAPLGVATLIVFVAVLQLGSTLSVTPGNIGLAELGFAGMATLAGYEAAVGVVAGAVVRAAGLVSLVGLALPTGALKTAREFAKSHS